MQGYETARKDAEAPMASSDGCEWFVVKLSVMIGLICLDIGLNSSLESDLYKGNADLCFLMLGAHVIAQVLISLALFLMLCDTYLFRVGLLGILFKHFKHVLMLQPIYVVYTLFLDGYRVRFIMSGNPLYSIYNVPAFVTLAIFHKLVAAVYYMVNIRATLKLGDPMFYSKEPWMNLYFQTLSSIPGLTDLKKKQPLEQTSPNMTIITDG